MKAIRDIARTLKLSRVSVREWAKANQIPLHPRLPRGARGGQLEAHIDKAGEEKIREHYRNRLASRTG